MVGQQIGNYKVLAELGSGAMSVVYAAHDLKRDREVALKFLPEVLGLDQEAQQRFAREAQVASRLRHPNIARLYNIEYSPQGETFIIMARYYGETLAEKLRAGALPLPCALRYAQQIALALQHAHEANIIHRDIKPANIFITQADEVKVLDFGIAKLVDNSITRTGMSLGTLAYMSPEQLRAQPIDGRADVWSWGVTLFEMLTGQFPFHKGQGIAVMFAVLNDEPARLRDVVATDGLGVEIAILEALQQVLDGALAKEPEERFASLAAVLSALEPVQHSLGGNNNLRFQAASALLPRPPKHIPATLQRCPNNLSKHPPKLWGRDNAQQQLSTLLQHSENSLLWISGLPGVGKTTLVHHLALRQLDNQRFIDGVYWLQLSAGASTSRLAMDIASTLGMHPHGYNPWQGLNLQLENKRLLLIIDDFEQLLDGDVARNALEELLWCCLDMRLIILAQHPPQPAQGLEHYPLEPLPLPSLHEADAATDQAGDENKASSHPDSLAALQLMHYERAQRQPALATLSDASLYCLGRAVAGLPLALLLSARQLRDEADVEALLELLPKALAEAAPSSTDSLANNQAASAALDSLLWWLWRKLSRERQQQLCALSIFQGGFSAQAAQAVTALEADALQQCLQEAWLQQPYDGRYLYHPQLQAFSAARLQEQSSLAQQVRSRHATYYLRWLAQPLPYAVHSHSRSLAQELANMRLAWYSSNREDKLERADQLEQRSNAVASFSRMYDHFGCRPEGIAMFEASLELLNTLYSKPHVAELRPELAKLRNVLLANQAWLLTRAGEFKRAQHVLQRSLQDLSLLPNAARAQVLQCVGQSAQLAGLYSHAEQCYHEALEHYQHGKSALAASTVLEDLGRLAYHRGNYPSAERYLQQSLRLVRAQKTSVTRQYQLVHCLSSLAECQLQRQLWPAVRQALQEAERLAPRHAPALQAMLQVQRGQLAHGLAQHKRARNHYQQGQQLAAKYHLLACRAAALRGIAHVAIDQGELEQAKTQLHQAIHYLGVENLAALLACLISLVEWQLAREQWQAATLLLGKVLGSKLASYHDQQRAERCYQQLQQVLEPEHLQTLLVRAQQSNLSVLLNTFWQASP